MRDIGNVAWALLVVVVLLGGRCDRQSVAGAFVKVRGVEACMGCVWGARREEISESVYRACDCGRLLKVTSRTGEGVGDEENTDVQRSSLSVEVSCEKAKADAWQTS